jgi:hypothetical protein
VDHERFIVAVIGDAVHLADGAKRENFGDGVLVIPHWRGTARVFSLLVNFQKPAVAPYAEGVSGAEGAFQEGAVAD